MKSIRCIARAKDAAWGMYNVPSPKAAHKEGFRYSAGTAPEKTIPPIRQKGYAGRVQPSIEASGKSEPDINCQFQRGRLVVRFDKTSEYSNPPVAATKHPSRCIILSGCCNVVKKVVPR